MAGNPKIFIQHKDTQVHNLVSGILMQKDINASNLKASYEWNIENKYYKATVDLCLNGESLPASLEDAEALVLYLPGRKGESFSQLQSWLSGWPTLLQEAEPSILLCVRETADEGEDYTEFDEKLTNWCLDHGFEYIVPEGRSTEESDLRGFEDKAGIDRVIEALHAHTWPNLEMVDRSSKTTIETETEAVAAEKKPETLESLLGASETERMDHMFFGAEPHDDDGSFESAFSHLASLRERCMNLPDEQRKDYAERVVLELARRLGWDDLGDEDDSEPEPEM
eukprot:Colp12_sorted_trinity150504_noHs@14461